MIIKDSRLPEEVKQAIKDDNVNLVIEFAQEFEKTGGWHGITLVNLASEAGSMKTLKSLMKHYPNGPWNVYTFDLKDVLNYALEAENALEVIDFLFTEIEDRKLKEKNRSPCDIHNFRNSILISSAKANKLDVTAYLLDKGSDIELLYHYEEKTVDVDNWLSKYILNKDLNKTLHIDNYKNQKLKI